MSLIVVQKFGGSSVADADKIRKVATRVKAAVEQGFQLVVVVSALSGFASAGLAGILTISLIGTACNYLGLPFEAAFILFVAVDPVCAMSRTAVTVLSSCAAVSMVCSRPEPRAQALTESLPNSGVATS
jgi:Na+/H+-dicarboxylate symporter